MKAASAPLPSPAVRRRRVASVLSPYERICHWMLEQHPLLWRSRPVEAGLLCGILALLFWAAIGFVPTDPHSMWTLAQLGAVKWTLSMATAVGLGTLLYLHSRYAIGEMRPSRKRQLFGFNLLGLLLITLPYLCFDAALTKRIGQALSLEETAAIAAHNADAYRELCERDTPETRRLQLAAALTADLNRFGLNPDPKDDEKVYRWATRQLNGGCMGFDLRYVSRIDLGFVSRFDLPVSAAVVKMVDRIDVIQREQGRMGSLLPGFEANLLLGAATWFASLGTVSATAVNRLRDRCRWRWPRLKSWVPALARHDRQLLARHPLAWALGGARLSIGAFVLSAALCMMAAALYDGSVVVALGYLALFATSVTCPALILRLTQWRPDVHEWHAQRKVVWVAGLAVFAASLPALVMTACVERQSYELPSVFFLLGAYFVTGFVSSVALATTLRAGTAVSYWFAGAMALFPIYSSAASAASLYPLVSLWWPVLALLLGLAVALRLRWKLLRGCAAFVTSTSAGFALTMTIAIVDEPRTDTFETVVPIALAMCIFIITLAVLRLCVWPLLERCSLEPK